MIRREGGQLCRKNIIQWTDAGNGNMVGTTGNGTHTIAKKHLDDAFEAHFPVSIRSAAGQPCYRALAGTAMSVKSYLGLLDSSWPDDTIEAYVNHYKNHGKELLKLTTFKRNKQDF